METKSKIIGADTALGTNEYTIVPLMFDCEGEFGDDEGSEDGYENCLWDSGDEED